ncbi:MAG: Rid family detoxifying hydrolase [Thermoleophilaceae bacterium]
MPTDRVTVKTDAAPAAIGPYSQAVRAGDLVFCSGQIPLDPSGSGLVGQTPAEQATQCLRNLAAVAEAAEARLEQAVRLTVYTTDLGAFAQINAAYGAFFEGKDQPARAAVGVAALPMGAQVEIDAILHSPQG